MPTNPVLSIIIPSYNHASYIAETIESLLGQTFSDFELIIVDDGSSDDSPAIIKNYAMQDTRIISVFQENQGPSAAVNNGRQIACGQFISFHPSDDKSCPTRFETLIKYLNEHPECDAVGSHIEEIDNQGKSVDENEKYADWFKIKYNWSNPAIWIWQNRIASPTLVFRRSFFNRFGEYDPHLIYTQDWEMSIRTLAQGASFHVIPSKLVQYRSHANNLTNKNEYEVFREYAYICAKRLIPWLVTKNQYGEIFKCVNGFINHPVFKSFSSQERENLCVLLAEGFSSSYPDFCNVLADSNTDSKILAEQSSLRLLSKTFVQYITELNETNSWLESQRTAWENTAIKSEQYIKELHADNEELRVANEELRVANEELRVSNALLESQRATWENIANGHSATINALYASSSWKLTRPMRFLVRQIKSLC